MTDVQELMKRLQASLCPNKLQEEIESALQQQAAEIAEYREKYNDTYLALDDAARENTALKAKLDEAEKQTPIGWCELSLSGKSIAYFDGTPLFMAGPVGNDYHTTPLYTRPIPAQDVNVAQNATDKYCGKFPLKPLVNAALSSAQAAPARVVPDGWLIRRAGQEISVCAPDATPGMMYVSGKETSLPKRLLYALADALLAAAPQPKEGAKP